MRRVILVGKGGSGKDYARNLLRIEDLDIVFPIPLGLLERVKLTVGIIILYPEILQLITTFPIISFMNM
jgi:hypothetical protein